ncbi:MAG: hypothetical protein ACYCYP_02460 [Leptospirales bacterium]
MPSKHLVLILDGLGEAEFPSTLERAATPCLDRLAGEGTVGLLDIHDPDDKRTPSSERGILSLCGALETRDSIARAELLTRGMIADPGMHGPHWVWLLNPARVKDGRLESFVETLPLHTFWEGFLGRARGAGAQCRFRYFPIRRADGAITRMAAFFPIGETVPSESPVPGIGEHLPDDGGILGDLIRESSLLVPPNPEFNCVWPWGMGKWSPESEVAPLKNGRGRWMVAAVPLARSIGKFLGWMVPPVPGGTGDTDTSLESKREIVLSALANPETTHVFCHIEGFDLASHRRRPEEKQSFLEKFDRVFGPALLQSIEEKIVDNLWLTCDHLSSPITGNHEHGPVPFLHRARMSRNNPPKGSGRFEESSARLGPKLTMAQWKECIEL